MNIIPLLIILQTPPSYPPPPKAPQLMFVEPIIEDDISRKQGSITYIQPNQPSEPPHQIICPPGVNWCRESFRPGQ